jgi:phosphatidylglycerol lysyltransferase
MNHDRLDKRKILRILIPLISSSLFALALWFLYRELKNYHYHDIIRYFQELPAYRLALAILSCIMSYLMLTGYDTLGLRYAQHSLKYGKTAFTSFTGYAFSNSIGYAFLSGGFIRYRLYSAWGLSAVEIAKVIVFCSLTAFTGFITVAGIAFTVEAETIPSSLHIPIGSVRPIGIACLALLAGYLLVIRLLKKPLKIRGYLFQLPSVNLALAQIVVSSMDSLFAGSALFLLLPVHTGISLPGFIGIFMLAQLAGTASQVPGGLGVFEMVMVLLLPSTVTHAQIIGSLISFRIIYYILPLIIAGLLFGFYEIIGKKLSTKRFPLRFTSRAFRIIPSIFAVLAFLGGVVLLFSGAIPAVQSRIVKLSNVLPLPIIEASHFLGSIMGIALIFIALGLQRRLKAAYYLTVSLVGAGILFSLMKGLRYEEAIVLGLFLLVLIPSRNQFYRKSSLTELRFTPGWFVAIGLVLMCFIWLGLFSYRHVEYSGELWWQFSLRGDASRFLRVSVGAASLVFAFSLSRLIRPAPIKPSFPDKEDLEKARTIVHRSRNTDAALALTGDKGLVFNKKMNAFIMYGIEGRSWVSLGDPVGPEAEWQELFIMFRDMSARHGGLPVFYEVDGSHTGFYCDLGLALFKFGEQGRVPLKDFSLEGSTRKDLRQTLHHVEKEGFRFEIIPPEGVSTLLPDFKRISNNWLNDKNTKEKGFSLGFFSPEYLTQFPHAVIRNDEKIVAFANILTGAEKEEISVDLMRYGLDAPHGVMEYLFVKLMLQRKQDGYRWLNLGMAPLAGLENDSLAPVWDKIGTFIFKHGEHFYNFQGLRQYKQKFNPVWQPKYIALPGGLALPRVIMDIATLISGGIREIFSR